MEREQSAAHRFPEPPFPAAKSPLGWGALFPAMLTENARRAGIPHRVETPAERDFSLRGSSGTGICAHAATEPGSP